MQTPDAMRRNFFVCMLFVITCELECKCGAAFLAMPMRKYLPICDDCSRSHRLTLDPPFFMFDHNIYKRASVSYGDTRVPVGGTVH